MARAVIIGAGLMGSAMTWPLLDNGHSVAIVGTHLDDAIIDSLLASRYHPSLKRHIPSGASFHYYKELPEVIRDADVVVNGVSSFGIHWIAEVLTKYLACGQYLVSVTKGLSADSDGNIVLFPDLIRNRLPEAIRETVYPVAIGGPCIAGELAARRQTCVMFGCWDFKTALACTKLFETSYYHILPSEDLLSLELGVAMKNAYTVAVGIAYGMHTEDVTGVSMHNTAAALFAQGCHEIGQLMEVLGGDERMSSALPGAGDLYVTSAGGRTMTLGKLLGEGKTYLQAKEILKGVTLESVQIINEMAKVLAKWVEKGSIQSDSFPLLWTLIDSVVNGKRVEFRYESFFKKNKEERS